MEQPKTLYVDHLRGLLDGEKQLVKALPTMVESSTASQLRSELERRLEQTKEHAKRLQQILELLGEAPKGKKSKGMQGILAETKETLAENDDAAEGVLRDSAVILTVRRAADYQIAAYEYVREYAQWLGENEAVSALGPTLDEANEASQRLAELARTNRQQALEMSASKSRTASA